MAMKMIYNCKENRGIKSKKKYRHYCKRCNNPFKPYEIIISNRGGKVVSRYHVTCAILIHLWNDV